ncbi:MAG: tRNA uridine-5-carboxymethylaminomethyl(34) synthesis GTPase MnmE [bacterium]|nr:tRNA uridine-5-carboxymethylaminomethyl(34) synthesis GTPase MnmE [bacterium]MDY4100020.1 tRNA uridine-5-carboxymethylaminomethyl(34) synthesis GTPase MnmE [Lachnospiraceae bacterium]
MEITEHGVISDTIFANASGMGGGITVIRVSGPRAIQIVDSVFRPKKKDKKLSEQKTYTMHYGHVVDENDHIVDEVLTLLMRAPHSYTAEDVVEIDCHGGQFVVCRIMEILLKAGARPAEPGEFTKRAFLNGRIDLSQAESVMDVINAKNHFALDSSMKQLHGSVKQKIIELREKILHESAFIEAALDDPEHYELNGYGDQLMPVVEDVISELNELLRNSDNGRILSEGLKTVIVGKPNAGKSSLMNLLLGTEYAIVTDVAGTTRDVLEKDYNLDGITLHITDTAGIRNTDDAVERIGVERAKKALQEADLVLYVIDSSEERDAEDDEIMSDIREKKVIVLLNKCDLSPVITDGVLKERLGVPVISCSAKYGDGLRELTDQIKCMFLQGDLKYNDELYITNLRHKECLMKSLDSMMLVKHSIEDMVPEDFYTVDLLNAYESLGLIIGEAVTDDLVDKIFHEFCMGK